ncbi:MAG: hypothetical protein ABEH88_06130 [Halobacteriales archaeon]
MSALERGAVIEYPAIFAFESYPRPYVIASGDTHPFHGEEYVGLAITTTDLDPAVPIEDDAWVRGIDPPISGSKGPRPSPASLASGDSRATQPRSVDVLAVARELDAHGTALDARS